ncbi:MAG TPA: YraN family protein [Bacteroidota bacterium]|nr:YraN family protein [Bacteroidota bacterium]
MPDRTSSLGRKGETIAVDYLRKKGYRIVGQNYRFGRGEIDIVALLEGTLVFVEVKTRRTARFGAPEEAVTPKKQNQIRKTAEGYLFEHDLDDQSCRFDVIAVSSRRGTTSVTHLENAF